jgi:hypothetical protein
MARHLLESLVQLLLHTGSLGGSASRNAFSAERNGISHGCLGSGSEGLLLVFSLVLLMETSTPAMVTWELLIAAAQVLAASDLGYGLGGPHSRSEL